MGMEIHIGHQQPEGLLFLVFLVTLSLLNQLEVPFERAVIFEDIKDKVFLDSLSHRICVVCLVLPHVVFTAKQFQGSTFGCSCKGKVAYVGLFTPVSDFLDDLILKVKVIPIFLFSLFQIDRENLLEMF